jgi:DNA-directed RNA polymerase I, II, and III subunit RPABC2
MIRITKYEKVRIIGERAQQIASGAPINVEYDGLTNALEIATKEYNERKIPFIIQRTFPNGEVKQVHLMGEEKIKL